MNLRRIACVLYFCSTFSYPLVYGDFVTRTIQTDFNDAEEHLNDPAFSGQSEARGGMESLTSSDLETSEQEGGLDWQGLGVQWDTLGIPQGYTINSATLTLTIDAVNPAVTGQSTDFTLYSEAIDDSADFAAINFNISSRARSTASVAWDASTVPTPEVVGETVSIDVQPLVQEIVNRPGWSPDNQLSIMIFPDVYLANPLGSEDPIRVLEFEAGPGSDSATLSVDFSAVAETAPELHIDTSTGEAVLTVAGLYSANVIGYEITSADSVQSLNPGAWTSITDNYDANSGPISGVQVDLNDNWTELPASSTTIAEAELNDPSGDGAQFGAGLAMSLGQIWTPNPFGEEVSMELLLDNGTRQPVSVFYDGQALNPLLAGDFNGNGGIDAGDWPTIRDNYNAELAGLTPAQGYQMGDMNGDGVIDVVDFGLFKDVFIAAFGAEAFAELVSGNPVPEPSTLVLLMLGGCALVGTRRRALK